MPPPLRYPCGRVGKDGGKSVVDVDGPRGFLYATFHLVVLRHRLCAVPNSKQN